MRSKLQVAVLVKSDRYCHREVVAGVARYMRGAQRWSVYLEDERASQMPDLRSWRGHGIIADLDDPAIARAVTGLKIPVVGFGGFTEPAQVNPSVPYVASDSDEMGRIAAEHLMACGLEHFAYLGAPRHRYNYWSERRAAAFTARLARAGRACHMLTSRYRSARRWEALQQSLCAWIDTLPRPIGILACNDDHARYLLEACQRLELRVPHDVAILGVDNDPIRCEMSVPTLSSIEQCADGVGYQAAAILDRMLRGVDVPRWTVVQPTGLVVRASTDFVIARDPVVARAIRFLYDHVSKPIGVPDVADHVGVSRSTLDKRFRRLLGRTVHDEIERLRVKTAQRLLRSTDLPIRAIATQSGYANEIYLGFVFRRAVGISPGKFRQQVRHCETTRS
jgi:LacI family transcriptional regulator